MSNTISEVLVLVTGSAVIAALITHYLGHNERERSNRRKLYAEALQTALGWREMLYRVRRRQKTKEDEKAITEQFHTLQENLDYYDGLVWSYSVSLGNSYRRLVKVVKDSTEPLLKDAWDNDPVAPQKYMQSNQKNPNFKKELDDFMRDTVRQLKPRYRIFAKFKLWWRNRG